MGEFAFAESFGMLDNEQYHHVIVMLRNALKLLGPFSPVLWLARIGLVLLPQVWRMADWNNMMAYCREKMGQRTKVRTAKSRRIRQDLHFTDASRQTRHLIVPNQRRGEEWIYTGRPEVSQW